MANSKGEKHLIYLDAMGGDFAPLEILKGAKEALDDCKCKIVLVGIEEKIKKTASDFKLDISDFEIINCAQEVLMDDHPSDVVRNKQDSSIYIGTKLVSENEGSAFISAGNTGAVMACSLINLKRIEGVSRPAIATVIPLSNGRFVLIDSGANVDCKPQYLAQFAKMGKIYSESILGTSSPMIGLLNIGDEEEKGNELVKEAYKLLKELKNINFIGNVEGRNIFNECVDVVVCDGFTGNILLKSTEGLANLFFSEIKKVLKSTFPSKLGALFLKNSLTKMKKKFDYEEYGGAFLVGVNGVVIISHGSSKAKAIKNAIKVALEGQKNSIVERIAKDIND